MLIVALNHVQLAMPPGEEDAARRFYAELLDIPELRSRFISRSGVAAGSSAVR